MSFIISGDTHGTLDIGKIVKFFDEHEVEYNDEDYGIDKYKPMIKRLLKNGVLQLP